MISHRTVTFHVGRVRKSVIILPFRAGVQLKYISNSWTHIGVNGNHARRKIISPNQKAPIQVRVSDLIPSFNLLAS